MFLPVLSIAILGALLIVISFKYLFLRTWFKAWLKATLAILAILSAMALLYSSWDLYSFKAQTSAQKIASVETFRLGPQRYNLVLELNEQPPLHFEIEGDMWQLDARLLVWGDFWRFLGMEDAFRFDRLSGRYHSIDDERNKPRTLFNLWQADKGSENTLPVLRDFKQWLTSYKWLPGASLVYGSGTFIPMKDRARFSVYLSEGGLQARAENVQAHEAIESWL
ncbi:MULTISPECIES: hypothetical protein [unclassified Oleiphilus]|jgi:hypothetical protein|uniref:hypothetical protein n=1 Tax=unclassified Oleiphilus TaxID=2631174 RepID=UPI0007C2C43E|nr:MULTISPECIES: hypothetical protein [unclassified Oleiphilus]KZY41483.1 hypothetical protein A3732_02985 [Oleiphilus sp. HI0050]KZY76128.1 hypothetical protein A3740_02015 [Oleiphilus sp. HI0068]KZY81380.1 hypothetical protein A3741_04470 [Oleiphilus sp. HI0069]KZZ37056.1 hypothetical protein A3755_05565 [Oleiphilus sp. HI0085]KZY85111.1 hypothetical protein A3741_28380 [Oleiphilus sp. HI0069]